MEEYLSMITDFSYVGASLGLLLATYAIVFMSCNNATMDESNRVISTLATIIRGEIKNLHPESTNKLLDNPYDLFASIYPSLKEMNNDRIEEFINLIDTYNSNWVDSD
jgi:hypothetical protein